MIEAPNEVCGLAVTLTTFSHFCSIVELFSDGESSISVLRSFRLLRIFKLVRFLPALRRQLLVMIHTMDNVMTFLALLILFIFTASILGMNLFGGKYMFKDESGNYTAARANFDDLFWALVTVFQVRDIAKTILLFEDRALEKASDKFKPRATLVGGDHSYHAPPLFSFVDCNHITLQGAQKH